LKTKRWIYEDLLHHCLYSRGIGKVREYAALGIDLNYRNRFGNSPILIASKYQKPKLFRFLIEQQVNINVQNKETGATPIMYLSYHKRSELVQSCIEYGADLTLQNEEGKTVVDYALNKKNNHKVLHLFLEHKNKLSEIDQKRLNALKFKILFREEMHPVSRFNI